MSFLPGVYWDSCVFIALIQEEPGRIEHCRSVMQAATDGKLVIMTSALTIAEVIRGGGEPPIDQERDEEIAAFFRNEYFLIVNVDRLVAERARIMARLHSLHVRDSIHIASALLSDVNVMHTYDKRLLGLNGRFDNPPMAILEPSNKGQMALFSR